MVVHVNNTIIPIELQESNCTTIIVLSGIENFWNQAKRHLRKYNGIPKPHFPLFLKECEWRFNDGSPKQLKTILRRLVKTYNPS